VYIRGRGGGRGGRGGGRGRGGRSPFGTGSTGRNVSSIPNIKAKNTGSISAFQGKKISFD